MKTKIIFILALLVLSSIILTSIPVNVRLNPLPASGDILTANHMNMEALAAGQEYWGSAQSDKFHYPYCRWAKRIKRSNLIVFKNRQEALNAGYVPCKVCKP